LVIPPIRVIDGHESDECAADKYPWIHSDAEGLYLGNCEANYFGPDILFHEKPAQRLQERGDKGR